MEKIQILYSQSTQSLNLLLCETANEEHHVKATSFFLIVLSSSIRVLIKLHFTVALALNGYLLHQWLIIGAWDSGQCIQCGHWRALIQ